MLTKVTSTCIWNNNQAAGHKALLTVVQGIWMPLGSKSCGEDRSWIFVMSLRKSAHEKTLLRKGKPLILQFCMMSTWSLAFSLRSLSSTSDSFPALSALSWNNLSSVIFSLLSIPLTCNTIIHSSSTLLKLSPSGSSSCHKFLTNSKEGSQNLEQLSGKFPSLLPKAIYTCVLC